MRCCLRHRHQQSALQSVNSRDHLLVPFRLAIKKATNCYVDDERDEEKEVPAVNVHRWAVLYSTLARRYSLPDPRRQIRPAAADEE